MLLRDKEKRAAYDRVGQGAQAGQAFHPSPGWDSGFEFSGCPDAFGDAGDHSAFLEALFGAARRGARGGPGATVPKACAQAAGKTITPRSWCRWEEGNGEGSG